MIIAEPEAVTGGLLHKMYRITTDKGSFALKALNPQIMKRPGAMRDIIASERIASALAVKLPAIPAFCINESHVQELNGRYYLIYPWKDGKSLKPDEVKASHSIIIGKILAEIHKTDLTSLNISSKEEVLNISDWEFYLQAGIKMPAVWTKKMTEMLVCLYETNGKANKAISTLSKDMVISHRDLDPKNVLWQGEQPAIIDWESAGYINPMKDLLETALYWSEDSSGQIEKEKFMAFIKAYNEVNNIPMTNWDAVLHSNIIGKLNWLEYNLKRSLGIEANDVAEQSLGTEQVSLTLNGIEVFLKQIPELNGWLNEASEKY